MKHLTDKFREYLQDQRSDNNVLNPLVIYNYMDYLTKELLPQYDWPLADIMDVGARAFHTWDYFKERHENPITGIDIGEAGLDYCEEHNKRGMYNMDAHILADWFAADRFDVVIALHSFEHMFDLPRVLQQIRTVLRNGGWLFYAIPIPSYNWERGHWYDIQTPDVMVKLLVDAGFTDDGWIHIHELEDMKFRKENEMVGLAGKPVTSEVTS